MVQGFINYLNNRQKAIDDAKAATTFSNVNVFGYAEANRVRDAINNNPASNIRMVNAVIPYVTNLDYVSYSSYDMQRLTTANMTATMDYIEAHVPTNKAAVIPGERVWIGEYGYANAGDTPAQQEPETRAYIQFLLNYGSKGIPYVLFWEIYDNETNGDGSYKYFYLIDQNNAKAPCYYLHQRFINYARLFTARFKEANGRLPTDAEFVSLVSPMLNQPLAAPVNLTCANLAASSVTSNSATVSGTFAQGVYGDDRAEVRVYFGRQDGGTTRTGWEQVRSLGYNTNFNPATFSAALTNLAGQTNYYFRFYATNASGEAWAPASSQFSTAALNASDYACRLKISFTGYNRSETLTNFPALVNLNTNLTGFNYRQFASGIGGDLRFTDAGGVALLLHEIDEWNTNGNSTVWVRVPRLTGTNDYIWAYWGNPNAAVLPAWTTNGAVWATDHLLVWHLKESGFPYLDSAQHAPALSGVAPASTTGFIGRGCGFNGSSQFLNGGAIDVGNQFTLSALVKLDPAATNIQTLFANKPGGWNADGFALHINSYLTADQQLRLETGNGTTGTTAVSPTGAVTFNAWHLITAAIDLNAGSARLYVDGADRTQTSTVQSDLQNAGLVNVGRFTSNNFYLKGTLDEARIRKGLVSSNWVWASWMTVSSNSAFASYSVVNPRPLLSLITTTSGSVLSWPASAGPFALYSATNLLPPSFWLPITNAASLVNGQWLVPLAPATGDSRFFRLHQ